MVTIHPERRISRGRRHGRLAVTMLLTNYGISSLRAHVFRAKRMYLHKRRKLFPSLCLIYIRMPNILILEYLPKTLLSCGICSPCSLVGSFRCFGGIPCNHPLNTRRHNPEDSNFHTCRQGNFFGYNFNIHMHKLSIFSPLGERFSSMELYPFCTKTSNVDKIQRKIFLAQNACSWAVRIPTTRRFYV
jgi:hypothetical protein